MLRLCRTVHGLSVRTLDTTVQYKVLKGCSLVPAHVKLCSTLSGTDDEFLLCGSTVPGYASRHLMRGFEELQGGAGESKLEEVRQGRIF